MWWFLFGGMLHAAPTAPCPVQLGVAAAVAFGLAVLRQTIKVLPLKQSPVLAKGMWLLGGAFVLARLTGGTLAHMTAMFHRNASRKRRLLQKLATVQVRVMTMDLPSACASLIMAACRQMQPQYLERYLSPAASLARRNALK